MAIYRAGESLRVCMFICVSVYVSVLYECKFTYTCIMCVYKYALWSNLHLVCLICPNVYSNMHKIRHCFKRPAHTYVLAWITMFRDKFPAFIHTCTSIQQPHTLYPSNNHATVNNIAVPRRHAQLQRLHNHKSSSGNTMQKTKKIRLPKKFVTCMGPMDKP